MPHPVRQSQALRFDAFCVIRTSGDVLSADFVATAGDFDAFVWSHMQAYVAELESQVSQLEEEQAELLREQVISLVLHPANVVVTCESGLASMPWATSCFHSFMQ